MARKATLEGTERRIAAVRTQIFNLERDLHLLGEDVTPFVIFNPELETSAVE